MTKDLANLCEAIVDCEHRTAPEGDGFALSVGTRAMKDGHLVVEACKPVSRSTYFDWTRRMKPKPGDLVLAREAPVGQVIRVPEEPLVCLGQRTVLIRPDPTKVHPRFLHYWLLGPIAQSRMAAMAGGATVAHLNVEDIRGLDVTDLPDSRQIQSIAAELLGALDDLIENNHRRIEVLEQMAQAVYREWFVHFRYPGHETTPVESSLGLIPEGWQTTTLGEAARWLSGGTPSTRVPEYWGGDIPWITSGTLTSLLLDRSERMVTRSGVENGTRLVERDTLLFVVRGMSLVKEFRVGIADVPLTFGQDCKALIAKPGIRPLFLAFSVISMAEEIQGMVELAGHGTGKLSTDRLKALTIPHPPEQLQVAFEAIVSPLRESSTALRLVTDRLDAIRDFLLPRLVTGRIDAVVLDLDAVVESVA